MYWAWAAAFLLKLIGATADASWHFKHLRESIATWPHAINAVGFALGDCLFAYQLIKRRYADLRAIRTTWAGIALFLIAIPLDDWYHRTYGIDLTSWSPTHALLYLGTFLMLAGTAADFLKSQQAKANPRAALWLSSIFCLFVMEDILFPLVQQEYGAVTVWAFAHGRQIVDADLLALIKDPFLQTYGSLPLWLYPVYLVGAYLFCMGMARRFIPHRWAATIATTAYLLFRLVARELLGSAGLPVSFIPYFTLGMAVVVDLCANHLSGWSRTVLGAVLATGLAYGAAFLWKGIAIMPIWPQESLWMAMIAGLFGLAFGGWAATAWLGEQQAVRAADAHTAA